MTAQEPGDPTAAGGFDLGSLLDTAQQMQEQLASAQEAAAATEVTGSAGGGVVRVTMTGALEFRAVHIAPEAVDTDDLAFLEDLLVAALNDAVSRAQELQESAMGGVDLPDIGGLLGGGAGGLLGQGE